MAGSVGTGEHSTCTVGQPPSPTLNDPSLLRGEIQSQLARTAPGVIGCDQEMTTPDGAAMNDPLPPTWVSKRDGRLEPFEADKISRALFAAGERLGMPDAFLAR